jgi:hypothetical protein
MPVADVKQPMSSPNPNDHVPSPEELEQAIQEVRRCPHGALMIVVPKIMCKECKTALPIQCYVRRYHSVFYAECLTFNLVSRGTTEEEAIRRLQVAMFSYVKTVIKPGASTQGLIPRPAPRSAWLRYRLHMLARRLFGNRYTRPTHSESLEELGTLRVAEC